jgi:hypothetical protein
VQGKVSLCLSTTATRIKPWYGARFVRFSVGAIAHHTERRLVQERVRLPHSRPSSQEIYTS